MKRLLVVNRTEFVIGLAALLGVLTFGVLWGVFIGVGLSIVWLLKVSSRPTIAELGRKAGSDAFVDLTDDPTAETRPDLAIVRFDQWTVGHRRLFLRKRAGRSSWKRRRLAGEFRLHHCFSSTRISFLIKAMTRCFAR